MTNKESACLSVIFYMVAAILGLMVASAIGIADTNRRVMKIEKAIVKEEQSK